MRKVAYKLKIEGLSKKKGKGRQKMIHGQRTGQSLRGSSRSTAIEELRAFFR